MFQLCHSNLMRESVVLIHKINAPILEIFEQNDYHTSVGLTH